MSKKNNPLFVVTNKGKDVEMAESFVDALVKKFNLQPIINILEMMYQFLLEKVNSYATFQILQKFLDDLVLSLENILKIIDPVMAFSFFKR